MKKILSAILAAVVVISLAIPFATPAGAAERSESGLKLSDWAVDSYHKANDYGILNWFHRNDDFTRPITRAEFSDMVFNVVRAISVGISSEIDVGRPNPFTDTDRYSVYCLEQLGIVNGMGDGQFEPNSALTREQAAAFLQRAGSKFGFTYIPEQRAAFTDAHKISAWAADAVNTMQESGLMIGTDTGELMPQAHLTREQAATMLVRFLEKNGVNFGIYVQDADGRLTLEDLAGLNGKYRVTGNGSYEITYCQSNFATLVVSVNQGNITSAIYTLLSSGEQFDLTTVRMDNIQAAQTGRYYLGGKAYTIENSGTRSLELNGQAVLTLPADEYASLGFQKMNGAYVAYAVKNGNTVFFALPDRQEMFTVDGIANCITNAYIITSEIRYGSSNVDSAYKVYGVYKHDGTVVESLGLSEIGLYNKGYLTDF